MGQSWMVLPRHRDEPRASFPCFCLTAAPQHQTNAPVFRFISAFFDIVDGLQGLPVPTEGCVTSDLLYHRPPSYPLHPCRIPCQPKSYPGPDIISVRITIQYSESSPKCPQTTGAQREKLSEETLRSNQREAETASPQWYPPPPPPVSNEHFHSDRIF